MKTTKEHKNKKKAVRTVRIEELVEEHVDPDSDTCLCLGGYYDGSYVVKPSIDQETFFYLTNGKPYVLSTDFDGPIKKEFRYRIYVLGREIAGGGIELVIQEDMPITEAQDRLLDYVSHGYMEYIESGFNSEYLQKDADFFNLFNYLRQTRGVELGEYLVNSIVSRGKVRMGVGLGVPDDDIPF